MASDEEPQNPFEFLLRDLARAMSAQGSDPSRVRDEFAQLALSGADALGATERAPFEELGPIASRYLPESALAVRVVGEVEIGVRTLHPRDLYAELVGELREYLVLFERALGGTVVTEPQFTDAMDPEMGRLFATLAAQAGPMMVNAQLGSVLGHFAMASLSGTELVLPRSLHAGATVAPAAIGRVAAELGAPAAEVGLWVVLEDAVRGPLIASPNVADRLDVELRLFLLDLRADAEAMGRRLLERGGIAGLGELGGFGLEGLFEAEESPARQANLRELATTASFVLGVARAALEELRPRLFGRAGWIESLADRREQEPATLALANLFGMDLAAVEAASQRFAGQLLVREDRAELVGAALADPDAFPNADELADVERWADRLARGGSRQDPEA